MCAVAGFGVVVELDAVGLRPAEHALLLRDGQRVERVEVVHPTLRDHVAPPAPGFAVGNHRDLVRLLDGRVLGAVDEAGEVAAVVVHEAGLLDRQTSRRARARRRPHGRCRASRLRRCRASTPTRRVACSAPRRSARTGQANPGAPPGATRRHRSGPKPITTFAPPAVTVGSRSRRRRIEDLDVGASGRRSNSRWTWDRVPWAKIPGCAVGMAATVLFGAMDRARILASPLAALA